MACITNEDYVEAAKKQASAIKTAAYVDTAIQAAFALWQRNSSLSIANMQNEIAKRNIKLAEAVHAHAKKFWPFEKAIVDDAFAENKATPQYGALSATWGSIMDDTLRRGRTDWLAEMRQRCLAPTKCEAARWDRVAQQAKADIISFADRQAESRAETLNDLRFARQLAALALGKGILNTVQSYQELSGTIGLNAGRMLEGSINSGLQALGYYTTRTQFDGWGQGAQQTLTRMPYQPQQAPQTFAVPAQAPITPAIAQPAAAPQGNCVEPPAGLTGNAAHAAWTAYYECKGEKF